MRTKYCRAFGYSILTVFVAFAYIQLQNNKVSAAISKVQKYSMILNNYSVKPDNSTYYDKKDTEKLLDSILPEKNEAIYEGENRLRKIPAPSFKTYPLKEATSNGKIVTFRKIYSNPMYQRPMYSPSWKDFYFRGWLNLPEKVSNASHRVFVYRGGGSAIFDFEGELAFHEPVNIDYHRNINILCYQFDVKSVKIFGNQLVLLGIPSRKGAEVISITQDDLLSEAEDTKPLLIQLATTEGYEIDFIYSGVAKYSYIMDQIKKNTVKPKS